MALHLETPVELLTGGEKLTPCVILGRLNRFVVEALMGGVRVRAYNTNTGRLEELLVEGRVAYCTAKRRARTDAELVAVECCGAAALVNTRLQEALFQHLVETGMVSRLRGCRVEARAPRVGGSRLDYLLDCGGERVYVELKSAVLRGPEGQALYPDAPTERGRRHARLLASLAREGRRAALVFIAGFPGATRLQPYRLGDPAYPDALLEALRAGVEAWALGLHLEPETMTIIVYDDRLPVDPRAYPP